MFRINFVLCLTVFLLVGHLSAVQKLKSLESHQEGQVAKTDESNEEVVKKDAVGEEAIGGEEKPQASVEHDQQTGSTDLDLPEDEEDEQKGDGEEEANGEEEEVKTKEFEKIVKEDIDTIKQLYMEHIKSRHQPSDIVILKEVMDKVEKAKLDCPNIFGKVWDKVKKMFVQQKQTEEERKRDQQWGMVCPMLKEVRPAVVDWINLLGKKDEVAEDIALLTVRPEIAEIVFPGPNDKKGEKEKSVPIAFSTILKIYLTVVNGKPKVFIKEIGTGPLQWSNQVAHKFIQMLEKEMAGHGKHGNSEEAKKVKEELEKIWESEKDVISGQTKVFKEAGRKDKMEAHVNEKQSLIGQKLNDLWNYGRNIIFRHNNGDKKGDKQHENGKEKHDDVVGKEKNADKEEEEKKDDANASKEEPKTSNEEQEAKSVEKMHKKEGGHQH